ncbi:MAG: glutamyl-tRNA reductase [Pseudomonadota bacterium]
MNIFSLGLNHTTAPVDVRERVAFANDLLGAAHQNLLARSGAREAVILSTCNRTELYYSTNSEEAGSVSRWLGEYHHLSSEALQPYLYLHQGDEAVRHLFRVAAGLDSLVLGEPQILGQLKAAYQQACLARSVGPLFNRLFHWSFSVAKRVRTETAIGGQAVSVAFAAVSLAKRIFGNLSCQQVLLIGAGETIELVARHLREQGVSQMTVANRTVERALPLAEEFDARVISLEQIPDALEQVDIVVSSTASPLPILGKGSVERALKARRHRPIFMVDIAVPRDIEPEVAELPDIYLYTVDDLQDIIQENMQARRSAAAAAEQIIAEEVAAFGRWRQGLETVPTIRLLREHADRLRRQELERALRHLRQGQDPEQVLEHLSQGLTNKLLHQPTVALRAAGESADSSGLVAALHMLFDLDKNP